MSRNEREVADREGNGRETSRRGFLTVGTAALAGVAAAAAIGSGVQAAAPSCAAAANRGGILCQGNDLQEIKHYADNQALVGVVVRAWTDYSYYQVLTGGTPAEKKKALTDMGVVVPNSVVVLTQQEFEKDGFQKGSKTDFYVLPKPPVGGGPIGQLARDAMAAVPFGM